MIIWGVLLVLAGLALLKIVVGALVHDRRRRRELFAQLGFLGNSQYPLWALTALALNFVVLYALTVRWDESQADVMRAR